MKKRTVLSIGLALMMAIHLGCNESTDGPCEVSYADPILQITHVTDAASGEEIEAIELWDLVNEREAGGSGLPDMEDGIAEGITKVEDADDRYSCELPCGFGTQDGVISFQFEAPGYQASSHSVAATYQGSDGGGCPVTFRDGTQITLELDAD